MIKAIVKKENIKLYFGDVQEVIYGLSQAIDHLLEDDLQDPSQSYYLQIKKLQRIRADLRNQIGQ